MSTAFVNAHAVRLPGASVAGWVLEHDGVIVDIGTGEAPPADRIVDAEGGMLLPAFCDAHVHLPATGLYEAGLDLRGETSADAILDAFAAQVGEPGSILFGGNFEDPLDRTLTRRDLDRAVGEREALLARADMHSCVVSTTLLRRLDVTGVAGVDVDEHGEPTGYLRERAAAEAWTRFDESLSDTQQEEAVRAAARRAYSKGVAEVHEMFVVEWRGWRSLELLLRTISDLSLRVEVYPGTDEIDRVRALGFDRIGGDYFLDGSFGSHSAWMSDRYATDPPEGTPANGIAYRDDDALLEFFLEAQSHGLQVGVHAIGDAAIEQAIRTWAGVADKVGVDQVRRLGHRIEHFECASDDHIARAAALGLRASVQPAFDAFWGGPDGLYTRRIGWERAQEMNRFSAMVEGGLLVGAGSDSTVTPLDPLLQIAALRTHHIDDQRLGRIESLRLHTTGAFAQRHGPGLRGTLEPGAAADLVLLDRDVVEIEPEGLASVEVLGTWIGGRRVWPEEDPA
jgi:predicted amidohydrolase YtcJ